MSENFEKKSKKSKPVKKERKVLETPRPYQVKHFNNAKVRNIVLCAPTGSGKTRVAVLLIEHMLKKQPNRLVFFLVHKVILVHQQHNYISKFLGEEYKIGKYHGEISADFWSKEEWLEEMATNDVIVLTAQILLNCLTTGFVSMGKIGLIVFDEAHHCIKNSPYNRIMKEFYFPNRTMGKSIPKIFGMTASPYTFSIGRLSASREENEKKLREVQQNLASVVNIVDQETVFQYYSHPNLKMISFTTMKRKTKTKKMYKILKDFEKMFQNILQKANGELHFPYLNQFILNLEFLLLDIGPWGLIKFLQLCKQRNVFSIIDEFSSVLTKEEKTFRQKIITEFLKKFDNYENVSVKQIVRMEISDKVRKLIQILLTYINQKNFCCIVFVERRVCSFILSKLISKIKIDRRIKVTSLFGHGNRTANPLTSMKYRQQEDIMKNFGHNKEVNLLISTNVAEEGIDIQSCNLVIRFDIFPDLRSYIQSRGRARNFESDYIILYDSHDKNHKSLSREIRDCESKMISTCQIGTLLIPNARVISEESLQTKSAKITLSGSVSLLNNICSLLPRDSFFLPKPEFFIINSSFGYIAELKLPSNSPIKRKIIGKVQRSKRLARASAALEALKELYNIKYITENLLPLEKKKEGLRIIDAKISRIPKDYLILPSKFLSHDFISKESRRMEKKSDFVGYIYQFRNKQKNSTLHYRYAMLSNSFFYTHCIPHVGVYFYENTYEEFKVEFIIKVVLTFEQFEMVKTFHHYIFHTLFCMRKLDHYLKHYLIIPIKDGTRLIDWNLIIKTCKSIKNKKMLDINEINDRNDFLQYVLRTVYNQKYSRKWNVYEVIGDSNVTPLSPMPEVDKYDTYLQFYEKKHFLENINPNQRMVKAKHLYKHTDITHPRRKKRYEELYLLTQFCEVLPLTKSEYMDATKIFAFFQYFESCIKVVEFIMLIYPQKRDIDVMFFKYVKEAFTLPSANKFYNYERLEFLGDCLLKQHVSEVNFFNNTKHHEGLLHEERAMVVCNNNLFDLLEKKRVVPRVVIFEKLNDNKKFRFPGYSKEKSITLSCKQIADICEALMGAFYMAKGRMGFLNFCKWLDLQTVGQQKGFNYSPPICTYRHRQLYKLFKLHEVEEQLTYKFKNIALLVEAMTHPSFGYMECFQRLEFLGDAFIDFLTTEKIFEEEKFENLRQAGKLSLLRSSYVGNRAFAVYIMKSEIYTHIIHNSKRLKRLIERFVAKERTIDDAPKLFGDVFESLCGAVYIDSGYKISVIRDIFQDLVFGYKLPKDIMESCSAAPLQLLLDKYFKEREKSLLEKRYEGKMESGKKGFEKVKSGKFDLYGNKDNKDNTKVDIMNMKVKDLLGDVSDDESDEEEGEGKEKKEKKGEKEGEEEVEEDKIVITPFGSDKKFSVKNMNEIVGILPVMGKAKNDDEKT